MFEMSMDTEPKDVVNFLVEHAFGQTKRRDLAQHKPAAFVLLVEKVDLVTERCEVARDGQRSGPGADQRDLFAV